MYTKNLRCRSLWYIYIYQEHEHIGGQSSSIIRGCPWLANPEHDILGTPTDHLPPPFHSQFSTAAPPALRERHSRESLCDRDRKLNVGVSAGRAGSAGQRRGEQAGRGSPEGFVLRTRDNPQQNGRRCPPWHPDLGPSKGLAGGSSSQRKAF